MDGDGFSGVVRLTNVSDFITPSTNCIIPLAQNTTTVQEPLVSIRKRESGREVDAKPKKAVKVTLNDCLACNGCITSAETVLIEEQSLSSLLHGVKSNKLSVVTVSPQSVCSIAAKRGISAHGAARLIASYFISNGVTYVLDSSFGRLLSLELSYTEFVETKGRPIMASACPGFVCYAEKTHGKVLVPLLSRVRSPQAIMGSLVKDYLARKFSVNPSDIYHAAVMPCFDKKLEASRPDFYIPGTEIRQTDCVISTTELHGAMLEGTLSPQDIPSSSNGWLFDFSRGNLISGEGGTSGGFAEYIVKRFMVDRGGVMKYTRLAKNLDQIEVLIENEVVLRAGRVYGFRNIQNMMRKLKIKKFSYDYVEVMACPSGCANGGAQIRAETSNEREELLASTEAHYSSLNGTAEDEIENVRNEWSILNPNYLTLLSTQFHVVESNIGATLQW